MDKNEFLNILKNPDSISGEAIEELKRMALKHPFSQLPYFLLAKYYYNSNHPERDKSIQLASAYAADRKVLKKYITEPYQYVEKEVKPEENTEIEINTPPIFEKIVPVIEEAPSETEIKNDAPEESVKAAEPNVLYTKDDSAINKETPKVREITGNRENRLLSSFKLEPKEKVESEEDLILDNFDNVESIILKDVEKLTPISDDTVRKDQDEIIDKFIQSRPSLTRPTINPQTQEQSDLAEKSIALDSELISENLAVIMAKQGKVEKAIDIYRKLIWKYPQKKAYFVDRIEELNKK